jgi:DNA polymerase-3 subunit epsilon
MMQALHTLRIRDWPHPGPIVVREHDALTGRTEIHVLDRWRHLGTAHNETDLQDILETRNDAPFDPAIYRILVQYLKSNPRDTGIVAPG